MRTATKPRSMRAGSLVAMIAVLLVGGAAHARAAFYPDSSWRTGAADASLLRQVADKAEGPARKNKKGDKDNAPANSYSWAAVRGETRLKLRGAVPSEEDRRTLLGMVKANFPDLKIDDKLRVAEGGPPRELWLGAVSGREAPLSASPRFDSVSLGFFLGGELFFDGLHSGLQVFQDLADLFALMACLVARHST